MKSRNYFVALALVSLSSTVVLAGGVPEPEATESDSATTSVTTGATQTSITETPSSTATETSASGATASTETEQAAAEPEAEEPGFIAIEDDPLIVDASAIMDDDGMGEVTVQWQISSNNGDWMNISGATQQSFTPREIHVGKRLRVVITYVDGQGNLETLVSPGSNEVENVNDKPTGSPILTGSAREEDALVVETS